MSTEHIGEIDLLLAKSLKQLASRRPIEKITIREITEGAGVIRPTFYNHFQDKYELLEWIIRRDLTDPIGRLVARGQLKEAAISVMSQILQDQAFYFSVYRLQGQNSFEESLRSCFASAILKVARVEDAHAQLAFTWLTPEMVADYYAHSVAYIVISWIRGGMKYPPQEYAEAIMYLWEHSTMEIFEEIQE